VRHAFPLPKVRISSLVTSPPALSDDLGHLVHLSLRTAERPEPPLRELSRALVLAVAEKFDDTALVWCKAVVKEYRSVSVSITTSVLPQGRLYSG